MFLLLVAQSWPTLLQPMDFSPPGSSLYGISQARILEWVAISFPRESSQPGDLHLLHRRRILDHWATSKAQWWDICHIILILILWRGEEVAVEIEKYEALTFFPGGWPALEEDVSRFFFPFPFWLRAFTCAIPSALYASPPTYWVNPYSSFRTQLKASLPQRCLPRLPWFGNTFTRHA